MLEKSKIVPIREQIADQLRSDIIAGELAPNEKLNEQALASRFGVSRGPIRDVLLNLTKEGLLVTKNNCGASVSGVLTPEMQKLMITLRHEMEFHAVEMLLANDLLTEEDFQAMYDTLDAMVEAFEADDFTGVTKIDIAFHSIFVKRAGGEELLNLWQPIILRMRLNYARITQTQEIVDEHRAIIEALKAKDLEAAKKALMINIR